MKSIISLLTLFLALSQLVFAQKNNEIDPAIIAQRQTDQMQIELQLKNNQLEPVHALNFKYATEIYNIKTSGLKGQVIAGQMQKIRSSRMKELKTVLSKDQYKQYQKQQNANQQQNQKGKGNGKGNGQGRGQGGGQGNKQF
ncbi:MAG: hypothetical protein KAI79_11430 [Bacteroidales bacterium]|nr:hypothetical protein [Bacteroidales bacterium]